MSDDIYSRLGKLAASAQTRPEAMPPVLLRVITDLFVLHPRHTPQEILLYEEMASKLVSDADPASLIIVAQKLSDAADAPASVLSASRRLARRGRKRSRRQFRPFISPWPPRRRLAPSAR
jgi:hypothetical protein